MVHQCTAQPSSHCGLALRAPRIRRMEVVEQERERRGLAQPLDYGSGGDVDARGDNDAERVKQQGPKRQNPLQRGSDRSRGVGPQVWSADALDSGPRPQGLGACRSRTKLPSLIVLGGKTMTRSPGRNPF